MPVFDLSGDWLKALFTAATLIISYAGFRLSKRGQDTSNREQHFAAEFAALKQVNQTLEAENARQRTELAELRTRKSTQREEWESRWARQMDRCRNVTDSLAATIVRLQPSASPQRAADAELALGQLEEHRARDAAEAQEFED